MAFRDGPFENLKLPLAWTAAAVVVVGVVAAIVMLASGSRQSAGQASYMRAGVESATAPVGEVLSAPVRWTGDVVEYVTGYFFAVSENRRLREQVAELSDWRDEAIALKNINARYEQMLGIHADPPIPMVTGRTVLDSRGPFARARLINLGSRDGVRPGNPALSEHGIVGRISGVSHGVSRLVLVTDVSSRIPVMVERTDARAILAGDASRNPRLDYVRGIDVIQEGDRVITSGDGGGIPRGLPVGVVAKGVDGSWRVKLFSERTAIDYVRVLLFQDFNQLIDPNSLTAPALAAVESAPPPTPAQAAAINDAATRRANEREAQAERARRAEVEAIARERAEAEARAQAVREAAQQAAAQQAAAQQATTAPSNGNGPG
ncbi:MULTISPECIES: rod shape-determining protein MreC [unclassified Brevundimonas]|uniref:rod shape-determining protein MreC n=1 Tax=unclassified Brevundimonas TaxID=2622653 RepID=UPI0025C4D654|nr:MULTISPECIES: rod shape-determining protein MreC [unclassified Brevundimonas]